MSPVSRSRTTPPAAVQRLRPTDLAEVCAAVRDTASSAPRLLLAGTGSATGWGGRPETPDAVLDGTALTGVVAHNPADMTVQVRAGTRLSDLQAELAQSGQRVAFDPARSDASIAGLLATADAGPLQQGYGMLRDLVIGITVVLADGTAAGSGGHVIKNVAGYDLAKLFHGSLGTLGAVAEVVLRLHPLPESVRTVAVTAAPSHAYRLATRILAGGLEPAALGWAGGRLLVRLEGTADGTHRRAAALRELIADDDIADAGTSDAGTSEHAIPDDDAGPRLLTAHEAAEHWTEVDRVSLGGPGDTVLRFGALPTTAARIADALPGDDGEVGIRTAGSVGVGVYTVRLHGGDAAGHRAVAGRLRDTVDRAGGTCTLLRRDGLPDDFPAWGRPPAAVPVMRAIKHSFDPRGRFGAGRFAGWLPAPPESDGEHPDDSGVKEA